MNIKFNNSSDVETLLFGNLIVSINPKNKQTCKLKNNVSTNRESNIKLDNFKDIELLLFGEIEHSNFTDEQTDNIFTNFKEKIKNEQIDFDEFEDFEEENFDDDFEKQSQTKDEKLENAVLDFNAGYLESYEEIYEHYKPIMKRYGKRYNNEELAADLLDIVLLNAVKSFDSTAKTKFNTYFWKCVHNYVNCVRIHDNAQKRAHNKDMKSLNEKARFKGDTSDNDLETMIEDPDMDNDQKAKELKLSIMALDNCLKENEIKILLKVIDNYTLQEIGESLGVTAAAVCLSLKRIAKKKVAAKYLMDILKHN